MTRTITVADIGGTHARFALADIAGSDVVSLSTPVTLRIRDHDGFASAWHAFGQHIGREPPGLLGMAVAGAADGTLLRFTNNDWVIDLALLVERLGVEHYHICNDFGAVAHAIARLDASHFVDIAGPAGQLPDGGVTTIVGPGTGLGVAQLVRGDGGVQVVETEGGHLDFAPLDDIEDRLLARLRPLFGRVSTERLVSGNGFANIYRALAAEQAQELAQLDDRSLWAFALEGTDPLARAALDRFCLMLGSVTGDLALAQGANAVVLAGGLGLRLKDHLPRSGFAQRFIAKGRFERRMLAIPVKLVTYPEPGLYGAAVAFALRYS